MLQKQKRQTRLNLAACLGPTYYFNCVFGLFPGRYDLTNYTHSEGYDVNYKGPFYVTRLARAVGYTFWVYLICFYAICIITIRIEIDFLVTVNTINLTLSFNSVYYFFVVHSSDKIIDCFNVGYNLLQRRRFTDSYFVEIFFIFVPSLMVIFLQVVQFYKELTYESIMVNLLLTFVLLAETGMFSCIMTLCLAAQIVFEDVNKRLKSIKGRNPTGREISELMRLHWRTGEFADSLSNCFGGIGLVAACHNVLTLIVMILLVVNSLRGHTEVNTYFNVYSCYVCFKIAWTFILICTRSQQMMTKALETKVYLQNLISRRTLSEETLELIELFRTQTELREICLSARGCFQFNMNLILVVGNVIVTYVVAFLQME